MKNIPKQDEIRILNLRKVNKKLQARKPDSVQGYHLSGMTITGHLHPPTLPASRVSEIERAIQKAGYTWHFSPQGLPEYYNLL